MEKVRDPTYKRFITGPLHRFDDRNGAFSRLQRGEVRQSEKDICTDKLYHRDAQRGRRKGYEQEDYARAWAGRTIDTIIRANLYTRDLEVFQTPIDTPDKGAVTQHVKSAARWFGADLVGIAEVNLSWVYSHWGDLNAAYSGGLANPGDPINVPARFKYAVVMAVEMDYEEFKCSPAVEAASNLGYSQMAFTAPSLAIYIQQLGYHAMACGNDYALSIPLAVDAGLGELGRHGLLITEQFGPRVRICKVFTDLPLEIDSPRDIGVQHFCETCQRCAEACPGRAIMSGDRTDKPWDISNNVNVLKWPVKAMNCLRWWFKNASECGNCIRVCPYNKPPGWPHSSVRKVIKTTPLFDRFFVQMDKVLGYGKQVIR